MTVSTRIRDAVNSGTPKVQRMSPGVGALRPTVYHPVESVMTVFELVPAAHSTVTVVLAKGAPEPCVTFPPTTAWPGGSGCTEQPPRIARMTQVTNARMLNLH